MTVEELRQRAERRWQFVLVLITVCLGLNLISLGLVYSLKHTVDTKAKHRDMQLARMEAKIDHLQAVLAFLDTKRRR